MLGSRFFKEWGLILATTVGAGVFALPYVFYQAGWVLSLTYLLVLGLLVVLVHWLYFRVLMEVGRRERILGLVKENLGRAGFLLALVSILGGLILALVAYLILGARFLEMVWPGLGDWGVVVFWLLGSAPLLFSLKKLVGMELWGGFLMVAIVAFIFYQAWPIHAEVSVPNLVRENLFLPFGAILFSLAGWTAIEPIYDSYRGRSIGMGLGVRWWQFTFATYGSALIYLFFVLAILGSAREIVSDTISGLTNWPAWKLQLLGLFGLFALWTSYLPIGREIEGLVVKDFKWSRGFALAAVIFIPILLVFLGLKNFLVIVSLVGGIFLALQYFFLVITGVKVLQFQGFKRAGFYAIALVFLLGAVYEIYYFVIR